MISAQAPYQVQFFDLDPLNVMWHGNYPRLLELGRCALMEKIGYSYREMAQSGHLWPIVDLQIKYVRPLRLAMTVTIEAVLIEFENQLRIRYRVTNAESGEVLTKAETRQVAVRANSGEMCLESPEILTKSVRSLLS